MDIQARVFFWLVFLCLGMATAYISVAVLVGIQTLIRIWNKPEWEYGTVNGTHARRHRAVRNVQFILWNKGQCGHTEDYWVDFERSWWPKFVPAEHSKRYIA